MKPRAALVHGGGPTAVWNASLAGLALKARRLGAFSLAAARGGVGGLMRGDWIDLDAIPAELLDQVATTPGSAIGSSRETIDTEDYARLCAALGERGVSILFLSGGNGTMSVAHRLQQNAGGSLQVIGIPKTIDNDIPGCEWTPGYGSVARFFAHAARDAGEDNRSLPSPVMVLETLGRDTGWVAAATALARSIGGDPPHLIYLPERPVTLDQVCADVHQVLTTLSRCVIAVCEGMKDPAGQPFGAAVQVDRDGVPRLAATLGHSLARQIQGRLGVRARAEKPGLVGRCFGALASEADRAASRRCGELAARAAADGARGVMTTPQGELVNLSEVEGRARCFPQHWINAAGNDVAHEFVEWVKPIAGAVEPLTRLPQTRGA